MKLAPRLARTARLASLAAVIALPGLTGCQSLSLPKKFPWSKEQVKESEYPTPQRVVALWTEDVMTPQGESPVRGFGARLYFYNEKNQAIPVEGQLVVYGYDDSRNDVSTRAPDRKYVFTAEQFAQHYSKSDLGASYSVWIPWDQVGGLRKEVSLIPVLTTSSGKIVVGPQVVSVLSGKAPEGEGVARDESRKKQRQNPSPDVRSVAHWEQRAQGGGANAGDDPEGNNPEVAAPESMPKKTKQLKSSTIFLPTNLGRRMGGQALPADAASSANAYGNEANPSGGYPANGAAGAPQNYAPPPHAGQFAPAGEGEWSGATPDNAALHAGMETAVSENAATTAAATDDSSSRPRWTNLRPVSNASAPGGARSLQRSPLPAAAPPSARSQPNQFPAPTGPTVPPSRGPDPSARYPAGWQLPPAPQPANPAQPSRPTAW